MKVSFFVPGQPIPQGSLRSFAHAATGRVVTPQSRAVLGWRDEIIHETHKHVDQVFDGPVSVQCVFWLPRPKGHYGTGRNELNLKPSAPQFHCKPPDIDKLARAVLDALVYANAMNDDSQVVELHAAKSWSGSTFKPGVHIEIADVEMPT